MCTCSKTRQEISMCTDYRKLNTVTKTDSYPMPRIDDCIDKIGHSKYITKSERILANSTN